MSGNRNGCKSDGRIASGAADDRTVPPMERRSWAPLFTAKLGCRGNHKACSGSNGHLPTVDVKCPLNASCPFVR